MSLNVALRNVFWSCKVVGSWFNNGMRLTLSQAEMIRNTAFAVFGQDVRVILFGSRVNDAAKGGDVDLMVVVPNAVAEPALLSARVASRVSRAMNGRKVDVLLKAPNLMLQPIHEMAALNGVTL